MNLEEKINKRQEANREILSILSEAVEKYPDWRFGQILFNHGIIEFEDNSSTSVLRSIKDPFYDESVDSLSKIKKALQK